MVATLPMCNGSEDVKITSSAASGQSTKLFALPCSDNNKIKNNNKCTRNHNKSGFQPCCGLTLPETAVGGTKHEQTLLGCGHIGCNMYDGCIVCDSEQESRRWSGELQRMMRASSTTMGDEEDTDSSESTDDGDSDSDSE